MKLGAGPLMDPKLVEATREVVAYRCNINNDPRGVTLKYGVFKVPNFVFAKWNGDRIEMFDGEKEVAPLVKRIGEIAKEHTRDLPWEESYEKAVEKAKDGKIVSLFFLDEDRALVFSMLDDSLEELLENFVFVKYGLKSEESKKRQVKKAPTVIFIDAEGKELSRFTGKKTPKDLKKLLEGLTRK